MNIDLYDLVALAGVALLGVAVWMGWGVPGLIGYVGAFLMTVGIMAAYRQGG